jgi:hypothetical protein
MYCQQILLSKPETKIKNKLSVILVMCKNLFFLIFEVFSYFDISVLSVGNHFFKHSLSGLKQVLAKMKYSSPCLASDIFFKLANKYQIPYFTDDRSIFFFLNTLASSYRPHRPRPRMKLKKSGIPRFTI